jgi:RAB6A-GEF complex partner protein 1
MIGTNTNKILRLCWENGKEDMDYTLDLKRIPFGINQHVNYAVPIEKNEVHVVHMDYSPLLGGFAVTLSDGRAAFLTASNLKFDPNVSIKNMTFQVKPIRISRIKKCVLHVIDQIQNAVLL